MTSKVFTHAHVFYQVYHEDVLGGIFYEVTEVDCLDSAANLMDILEKVMASQAYKVDRITPTMFLVTSIRTHQKAYKFSTYEEYGHTCPDYKAQSDKWLMEILTKED